MQCRGPIHLGSVHIAFLLEQSDRGTAVFPLDRIGKRGIPPGPHGHQRWMGGVQQAKDEQDGMDHWLIEWVEGVE